MAPGSTWPTCSALICSWPPRGATDGLHRYWRSAFTERIADDVTDAVVDVAARFAFVRAKLGHLRQLKAVYDTTNLSRINPNIDPAWRASFAPRPPTPPPGIGL